MRELGVVLGKKYVIQEEKILPASPGQDKSLDTDQISSPTAGGNILHRCSVVQECPCQPQCTPGMEGITLAPLEGPGGWLAEGVLFSSLCHGLVMRA